MNKLIKRFKEIGKGIPRPFGIFVSGGLDSGILASLLEPDFAITCNFKGEEYDELKYARMICERLDIPLDIIKPDGFDFKEVLTEALYIIGKPVNSVSIYAWYRIYEYAKAMGYKTMVCGEGADEIFGGYSKYIILNELNNLKKKESLKGYTYLIDKCILASHSAISRISQDILQKRYEEQNEFISKIGWADFNEGVLNLIYMQKKLAGHFEIDLHLPFLDDAIQDIGWKLKDEEKVNEEDRKIMLKNIARDLLPQEVVDRKDKKGFISPCNAWSGSKNPYDKTEYLKLQEEICKTLHL